MIIEYVKIMCLSLMLKLLHLRMFFGITILYEFIPDSLFVAFYLRSSDFFPENLILFI